MGSKTSGRHVCVILYDRKDFPVGVFDNIQEVADFLKIKNDSVRHAISRCYAGKQRYIYDSLGNVYTPYKVKEN